MISKQDFLNKYYKFLGYKNQENIVMSENRNILINGKFSYPIILACVDDSIIISITSSYYKEFKEYLEIHNIIINKENMKTTVNNFSKEYFDKFEVKEMYRLYKKRNANDINIQEVEKITEEKKNNFFNIIRRKNNMEYKEEKWQEFNNSKAKYRHQLWNNKK